MTHPAPTQNQWRAAATAAAATAARLARRTRIRHGEPPRKPLNIAEWTLGSSFTVPLFCFSVKEFKVFRVLGPPMKQLLSIRRLQPHYRQKHGEPGRGEGDESDKRIWAGIS
jgi:hypothetical protein